jgi:Zn-dependent protease with chaperone function
MSNGDVKETRTGLSGAPMVLAILAVLIWVAFVVVMLLAADSGDRTWTRLTFVFGSVEAIAFAAAGALFGVSVQRERVQKAEERADAHAREAANGRALAAVNLADEATADGDSAGQSFGPGGLPDADLRRRHGEVARRLFPDM